MHEAIQLGFHGLGGMSQALPLIAVVDDDESMRDAVSGLMRACGFAVEAFASADAFLNSPSLSTTACLVADVHMPGMSGVDLHGALLASGRNIPTVLVTAYPNDKARARALGNGVLCYLVKPFCENELLSYVRTAVGDGDKGASR
jgi:FixJ family two-component response regulator